MKVAIVVCMLFLAAVAVARPGDDKYTDRYDNIDLDEILENKTLLESYAKCFLDQGKCTPEGKEFKEHVKEALETDCEKCTEKQKKGAQRVFKHLINHEPEYWTKLTDKYDPDKKYTAKYEKELREVAA